MVKQMIAYQVMRKIEEQYTASGMSDTEFAKKLSEELHEEISVARVRQARLTLGIANNKASGSDSELAKAKIHIQRLLDVLNKLEEDPESKNRVEFYTAVREAEEFLK